VQTNCKPTANQLQTNSEVFGDEAVAPFAWLARRARQLACTAGAKLAG
jgi:hypothetical protein